MKIRPKDHVYWEIVYTSQEEAQAVKDYLDQLLVRGFDEKAECPVCDGLGFINEYTSADSSAGITSKTCPSCDGKGQAEASVENAYFQHEQETSTG